MLGFHGINDKLNFLQGIVLLLSAHKNILRKQVILVLNKQKQPAFFIATK